MSNEGNYTGFTEVDFMNDAYFQEGVKNPEGEAAMFWRNWMADNPERRVYAEKARAVLERIGFAVHVAGPLQARDSLSRVWEMIAEQEQRVAAGEEERRVRGERGEGVAVGWRRWKWAAAAVLAMVVGAGAIWYSKRGPKMVTESTDYAVTRTLYLPDSSEIILNGHSSVAYKTGHPREVWLTGEAYFKIKTILSPFSVHASQLTVEVLGTAFDVRERRRKTEVVLDQGKVRVSFNGHPSTDGRHGYPDMMMQPGQRIIWDDSARAIEKSMATPGDFTDWRDGKLVLTDAALSDIITYVEDNYGQRIILSDPGMARRQIRGELLLDNLDDMLFVLSKVLNVRVDRHGGHTIILRPN